MPHIGDADGSGSLVPRKRPASNNEDVPRQTGKTAGKGKAVANLKAASNAKTTANSRAIPQLKVNARSRVAIDSTTTNAGMSAVPGSNRVTVCWLMHRIWKC